MKGNYTLIILCILILSLVSITSATLSSPSITPDTTVYAGDTISVSWNGGGTPLHWALCTADTVCQNEASVVEQTGAGTKTSTVPSYVAGKWFVVYEYYSTANHYHWYMASGTRPSPTNASFSPNVTSGVNATAVLFTDGSSGSPTAWNWSFQNIAGNNTQVWFSTSQNPTRVFKTGNYSIVLNASNAGEFNISNQITFINVSEVPAPTANFTMSNSTGASPLKVNFTDTSTGSPTSWNWSFGDGNYSEAQYPNYTYTSSGNYTIVLNVSNAGGYNFTTKYIETYSVPVASFTSNVSSGITPLSVNFTDTSTNSPTSWNWTFGGANFSDSQNPTYTFTGVGNYTVILNASNPAGWDNVTHYINVTPPPPTASFTMSPTTGGIPVTVAFTDTSTGTPTSWNWSFGDGMLSTDQNPSHTYANGTGTYTITLNASNIYGSNTTSSNFIATSHVYTADERITTKILDTQAFIVGGIYLMVGAVVIGLIATLFGSKP